MQTYGQFRKQADYITTLTHDDFDAYPYDEKNSTRQKQLDYITQLLNRTKNRTADRTDYFGAAKRDNPGKVEDIVVVAGNKPQTWQDWKASVQSAITSKDDATAERLLDPSMLYVRTDKPGIAAGSFDVLEPDTLTSYVNTAYKGKPRPDLVALLEEYKNRYGSYTAAKEKLRAAEALVAQVEKTGFGKQAAVNKTADYGATVPWGAWYEGIQWPAENVPTLDPADFNSWEEYEKASDDRDVGIYKAKAKSYMKYMDKLVAAIRAGKHMTDEDNAGAGETVPGEVYMPVRDGWTDDPNFVPYDEWKANARKLFRGIRKGRANNSGRLLEKITNGYDGFYVKTDGKRLGLGYMIRPQQFPLEKIYKGNIPAGVQASVKAINDADAKHSDALKEESDAKDKLLELVGRF